MALGEKQFQLGDGGPIFGLDAQIGVSDWTPGSPALDSTNSKDPVGDGVRTGRSTKGAAVWSFTLFTNAEAEGAGWDSLASLASAWSADDVRLDPGAVIPLYYRIAGKERVVFGRPTRWSLVVGAASLSGKLVVECDFEVTQPYYFEAQLNEEPINLGTPFDPTAGLIVPFIPPFTSSVGSSIRESAVTIGGTAKTPVTLKITGPIEDAVVRIGDWTAALLDPVPEDDPVTLDARPWVRASTYESGGGARVSPRVTRLSQMWLPPGHHTVVFTGTDLTGSAELLVSWRNAHPAPR